MAQQLDLPKDDVEKIGCHKRYVIYKVGGKVLCCSHGMGGPSISILLNEVAKLLRYSGADSIWIRLGTCGGVGLEPGTVAITKSSMNGALEPFQRSYILGKPVLRPADFDPVLGAEVKLTAEKLGYPVVLGNTMTADDFYEGQGRLDGAICDYTEQDKMDFLQKAHDKGVRNIEMESLTFAAFTKHIGIKATCVCAVLVNRLKGDQIHDTPEVLASYEVRAASTVLNFVGDELRKVKTKDVNTIHNKLSNMNVSGVVNAASVSAKNLDNLGFGVGGK